MSLTTLVSDPSSPSPSFDSAQDRFFKGGKWPWIAVTISAILSVLSHPSVLFGFRFPNLYPVAWIAYAPLFLVVLGESYRVQLRRLFLFGYLFNLGAMYWLYTAMNSFGDLNPFISVLVLLILSTVLTLYFILPFLMSRFVQRFLAISPFWTLPFFWVSFEWMRGHWPMGGFPWGQAGYSQAPWISFIQMADLTGVYGVTALLIWGNLAIVEAIKLRRKKAEASKFRIGFFLLLFGMALLYGTLSKQGVEKALVGSPKIKIALLQGNIPQEDKWLREKAGLIHSTFKRMSEEAIGQGADLVLWPEASFPFDIDLDNPRQVKIVGEEFTRT
jgi:apolipoprotein N-acyltransferase